VGVQESKEQAVVPGQLGQGLFEGRVRKLQGDGGRGDVRVYDQLQVQDLSQALQDSRQGGRREVHVGNGLAQDGLRRDRKLRGRDRRRGRGGGRLQSLTEVLQVLLDLGIRRVQVGGRLQLDESPLQVTRPLGLMGLQKMGLGGPETDPPVAGLELQSLRELLDQAAVEGDGLVPGLTTESPVGFPLEPRRIRAGRGQQSDRPSKGPDEATGHRHLPPTRCAWKHYSPRSARVAMKRRRPVAGGNYSILLRAPRRAKPPRAAKAPMQRHKTPTGIKTARAALPVVVRWASRRPTIAR